MFKLEKVNNNPKSYCYAVIEDLADTVKLVILVHGGINKSANIGNNIEEVATKLYEKLWNDNIDVIWYDCIMDKKGIGNSQELFMDKDEDNIFSRPIWGDNILSNDSEFKEEIIEAHNYVMQRVQDNMKGVKWILDLQKDERILKEKIKKWIKKIKRNNPFF